MTEESSSEVIGTESDFSTITATGFDVSDKGGKVNIANWPVYGMFNNDNAENDPDGRSDAKGPEPEAITVGGD